MILGAVLVVVSLLILVSFFTTGKTKVWLRNLAIGILSLGIFILIAGIVLYFAAPSY